MIVRWGIGELPGVLAELRISEPLLVTTPRWAEYPIPIERRFTGVRGHVPMTVVREVVEAAAGADGLVALGGGSAIDTAKATSAELGLPVVSVPTTYSGAEWTRGFGVRDEERRTKGGGSGARIEAIVYEPKLTVGLPPGESGGTALNALNHCAEALYAPRPSEETDGDALTGARIVSAWLPGVLADGADLEARTRLLEGAMHAGAAMRAGFCLGHAMAQALGGRYALSHGAMNALCLPAALRFNAEVAKDALARLAQAMGVEDSAQRAEELARLSGFECLRDFGVPEDELPLVAASIEERVGARANPRPASAQEILELLRELW